MGAGLLAWVWLALGLGWGIARPWINAADYNGAVWSQAAHNNLRAGLASTRGVPTGFYFGSLPIPPEGYYTHHPPGLPLVLTGLFAVAGEHEWVARLVPVSVSLLAAALLYWLVYDCTGRLRPATLTLAVLATLPMQLHYGRMVNHEPLALLAMLGLLVGLRLWQAHRRPAGLVVLFVSLVLGLAMAWHVYLFAALVAGWLIVRGQRGVGGAVLLVAVLALALFCLHIRWVRPDAWQNLASQFRWRLSLTSETAPLTWARWAARITRSLLLNIPWPAWLLAVVGAGLLGSRRETDPGGRWLGGACLGIFVLDALYVSVFRNASYIHDYAAYYFIVPVAVLAGLTLDRLGTGAVRWGLVMGVLVVLAWHGVATARQLDRMQFRLLTWDRERAEPEFLIPQLGRAIRARFPEDTAVLCNFLPVYGPHLHYYAQRTILNNLTAAEHWPPWLAEFSPRVAGVIWLDAPGAAALLAGLPAGQRETLRIGDVRFCFWQPR